MIICEYVEFLLTYKSCELYVDEKNFHQTLLIRVQCFQVIGTVLKTVLTI